MDIVPFGEHRDAEHGGQKLEFRLAPANGNRLPGFPQGANQKRAAGFRIKHVHAAPGASCAQHQPYGRPLIQFRRNGCQRAIGIHRIAEGFHHPGIALSPWAERARGGKAHLQDGGIASLAGFHAAENGAALQLGKIQRLGSVKNGDDPIAMAKDGGGGFCPKIKRNGAAFREQRNRRGAPGRHHDQRARCRGGLHLCRCRWRRRGRGWRNHWCRRG